MSRRHPTVLSIIGIALSIVGIVLSIVGIVLSIVGIVLSIVGIVLSMGRGWQAGGMTDDDAVGVALLRDGFDRIREGVDAVVKGMSPDELSWRIEAAANPLGWLVWHLTRQQDAQVAQLSGLESPWKAEWSERLGLTYKRGASGYGMSSEEVGQFAITDGKLLVGYHGATHELTMRWLDSITEDDWERVVDRNWDPPVTVAVRVMSVLEDSAKHLGQAEYLRGILLRRRG